MATAEQRQAPRLETASPINVWHPIAKRFFQGRGRNISRLGALLFLPMSAPVRSGQMLEIDLTHCEAFDSLDVTMPPTTFARILRVSRQHFLEDGMIEVAVCFNVD